MSDDSLAFFPVGSFLVNISKPFVNSVQSDDESSQFRKAPAISKNETLRSLGATLEIAVKKTMELNISNCSSSFTISLLTATSKGTASHPLSFANTTLVKRMISLTNPNLTPPTPSQLPAFVAIDFNAG